MGYIIGNLIGEIGIFYVSGTGVLKGLRNLYSYIPEWSTLRIINGEGLGSLLCISITASRYTKSTNWVH